MFMCSVLYICIRNLVLYSAGFGVNNVQVVLSRLTMRFAVFCPWVL